MADTADIAAAYMPGGTQQPQEDLSDEEEQPQVTQTVSPSKLDGIRAALGAKTQQVEVFAASVHLGRCFETGEINLWALEEHRSGLEGGQMNSSSKCSKEIVKYEKYYAKLLGNSLPGLHQPQQKDIGDLDDNVMEHMTNFLGHNSQVLDSELSKDPVERLVTDALTKQRILSEAIDDPKKQQHEVLRRNKEKLADLETEVNFTFKAVEAVHAKICRQKQQRNLIDARIEALKWLRKGLENLEKEKEELAEEKKDEDRKSGAYAKRAKLARDSMSTAGASVQDDARSAFFGNQLNLPSHNPYPPRQGFVAHPPPDASAD